MTEGGGNSTALTLYELFFDMTDSLCQRYPGITPLNIRREKVGEVFLLINRINKRERRKKGIGENEQVQKDSKGRIHIRRKATNDNWY